MSVNVTVNGSSYTIPQTSESGWGDNVTAWIQAISSSSLQKTGGVFPLSAELDLGVSFGVKAAYLKSESANPAATGIMRLSNGDAVAWRNVGNTADLALKPGSADGILAYNAIDLPTISSTHTFTNKSIDATTNTLSNIANSSISASAGIAYSKLALSNSVKNTDITSGASAASTVLTADGSGNSTWSVVPSAPTSAFNAQNLGIAASVASSALTLALKTQAGTDPSAVSPVGIGFRNSTPATGTYNQRSVTAALSIVVPSGASLGLVSGQNQFVHLYALDNAGTVELAVAGARLFDEGTVQNTTAISASATANNVLYSTSARTGVPVRYIGRALTNEATAGTWASTPTELAVFTSYEGKQERSEITLTTQNGYGSTNTLCRRFTTTLKSQGTAITYADSATLGASFTINEDGMYQVSYMDYDTSLNVVGVSRNAPNPALALTNIPSANIVVLSQIPSSSRGLCSNLVQFSAGDVIRCHNNTVCTVTGTDGTTTRFTISKVNN